ncbi:Imm50 family immunity protein [Actinopolyspora halophila]|uniref:Imm50 family immunity protein n=1 Tax=Actinopolyspora halophila TaxID=1850 RepID=UPI0012FB2C00|nr:Imm50 family immunity protein [Actinopolyspora halophila]
MSWLDLVDNTTELEKLYAGYVPSISGVHLVGVNLYHNNSFSVFGFSLPDFPPDPPEKWKSSEVNVVQLNMKLSGVFGFSMRGWEDSGFADLQIARLDEGVRVTVESESIELDVTANRARINSFAGYIVNPEREKYRNC